MPINFYTRKEGDPKPPDEFFIAKTLAVYNGRGYRIPEGKKAVVVRGGIAVEDKNIGTGDIVIVPRDGIEKIISSANGGFMTTERQPYDANNFPGRGVLIKSPVNNVGRREVFVGRGLYDEFILPVLDECLRVLGIY